MHNQPNQPGPKVALFSRKGGFTMIRVLPHGTDAPAECRREEHERNDGFCVVACLDGKVVADATGWRRMSAMPKGWFPQASTTIEKCDECQQVVACAQTDFGRVCARCLAKLEHQHVHGEVNA